MNRPTKVFLILLRIVIGWHFLYEGLWKLHSDKGSAAYTTAWYTLQTSVARLHDDPARADQWYDDVVKAFKGRNHALDEVQKARLAEFRDKVKLAAAAGEPLAFDWPQVRDEVLQLPPASESERFTALGYLQSSEGPLRPVFRGLVPDIDGLSRLTVPAAQAVIDARHREIFAHFAAAGRPFTAAQQARLAQSRDELKQQIALTMNDPTFQSRLADYRQMRARVAEDSSRTAAPFTRERLAADRQKLDAIAGELLAFTTEPIEELSVQAQNIATVAQLAAGPFPRPAGPSDWIDRLMPWTLTLTGALLMLGLFTPIAALAAAAHLLMFYFASPPWPGLPAASMAGHYLYIDRNLIECVAVLAVGAAAWHRRAAPKPAAVPEEEGVLV